MILLNINLSDDPLMIGFCHDDVSKVFGCLFTVLNEGLKIDDPDTIKIFGVLACAIEAIKIAHPDIAAEIRTRYILPLRKEVNK